MVRRWGQNHLNAFYEKSSADKSTSKIFLNLFITSLLIYDLQSEDWINTYYMQNGFLKACRPSRVSNETNYTNVKMIWNTLDLSSYVPKANLDHNISDHETGISTLDHSATTPRCTIHHGVLPVNGVHCMFVHPLSV